MKERGLFSSLLIGFIVFYVFPAVLPAEEIIQSKWAASPVQIDGLNEEWLDDSLALEKSVRIDYAFRNDDRNLYILVIFKDPKYLSSINMTGITLYFNTMGKKSKDYGVRCMRKTVTGEQLIGLLERQGTDLTDERKLEILGKPQYIVYDAAAVDKKGEEMYPAEQPEGVDPPGFKIAQQESAVVYEFRIPLASRDLHPAGIGTEPGNDLKVGFEWGGMTKEMKKAMRGQGAPSTGLDLTTETTTGQYGHEHSSAPVKPGAVGPKKHSFWVDVKLAQGQ
ncbi:MAG: hypothetical protein AB1715_06250 [Acidobacteriota bacterium]